MHDDDDDHDEAMDGTPTRVRAYNPCPHGVEGLAAAVLIQAVTDAVHPGVDARNRATARAFLSDPHGALGFWSAVAGARPT